MRKLMKYFILCTISLVLWVDVTIHYNIYPNQSNGVLLDNKPQDPPGVVGN
ncbi:hypothetical protein SAMN04488168_12024 [Bacillus sp. 491mf]|uniref:hypothetical protein n=1 Tax=Bacillus sp. 491mf TaxID=1761755 RepID=UPI0008EB70E6|nr:hypothetical protein [Bacillus sp. 491mf]SFD13790.1 hypothetical protein SAMN04488168_12024 [Bacillus sp. 491mf]